MRPLHCLAGGLAGALSALLLATPPAAAHPHIWIETSVEIDISKDRIERVRISWAYDDYFSAAMLEEFDRNKDRKFSREELALLEAHVMAPLIEFHFYTQARIGDRRIWAKAFRDFAATVKGGAGGEVVVFSFTIEMPELLVDPAKTSLALALYDETYYVEMAPAPKPAVKLTGAGAARCSFKLSEDRSTPLYQGAAFPLLVALACEGS